jgi:alpha-glucosidase
MYYGEELGMTDVTVGPSQVRDPFEKRVPGMGLGRDPERTPMQWTRGRYAGFSSAKPWLPVAPDYPTRNVQGQQADRRSSLWLYRRLCALRNESVVLQLGAYHSLELDNPYAFGYLREYEGQVLLVILNFSSLPETVHTKFKQGTLLFNTRLDREDELIWLNRLTLEPHEGLVIRLY